MLDWAVESLIALVALSAMEIVLGIDNLVFISILSSKLPIDRQAAARRWGLALALVTRLLLLCTIFWMSRVTQPLFVLGDHLPITRLQQYFYIDNPLEEISGQSAASEEHTTEHNAELADKVFNAHAWREFNEISLRDLILIAGGLFLLYKSIHEIHSEVEGHDESQVTRTRQPSFQSVLIQVAMMDVIFSIDSVITAVGMAETLWVMTCAVLLAVLVMILFANQVGNFVSQNPTIKMLALNFLLIIGIMLIAEGIGTPISKGYIYFAMGFSLLVEFLNLRVRKAKKMHREERGEIATNI